MKMLLSHALYLWVGTGLQSSGGFNPCGSDPSTPSSYPWQPTPDLLLPLEFLPQQTALASLFLPSGPLDHSLLHAALPAYPYLVQHRKVGKLLNQAL